MNWVDSVIRTARNFGLPARHSGTKLHNREYRSWISIHQFCENKNHPAYRLIGAVGITVAGRWRQWVNFWADMGECPKGFVIGRIDMKKNWEPGNVKWMSRAEQQRIVHDFYWPVHRAKGHKAIVLEISHALSIKGGAERSAVAARLSRAISKGLVVRVIDTPEGLLITDKKLEGEHQT